MKQGWIEETWRRTGGLSNETIETVDMHTAGEPLRIIVRAPFLPEGTSVLARRRDALARWDRFRRLLMFEPRGHADMYGALIVPAERAGSLFGVLFMHNEGYSTMCGHAIIALGRAAIDLGWVEAVEPITTVAIDSPAGLVLARVQVTAGKAGQVAFENVASFAPLLDAKVAVPGIGEVRFDLGFGGAFYAYVDADALGLDLRADNARRIGEWGMAIKHAVMAGFAITHPLERDLGFLYGTIFTGAARAVGVHSRHACVFADGAIDRSPTGTGVAGRVAILHAKGALRVGEALAIESLTGARFGGKVLRSVDYHGMAAVVPEVSGAAHFTGRHSFFVEANDPLADGFLVR